MINPKTFSWTGSNEREDGRAYPPEERRGYNVYIYPPTTQPATVIFTATSQAYDFSMPISDLGNPLDPGDWEMVVTDVDTDGRESDYSAPVGFTIELLPPKKPVSLLVS